jgi:ferric-dicitrate binding protein FerR (iron transport regulator)
MPWQAVAAVALAALVGILYVAGRLSDTSIRIATGPNEVKTVTLGDGSIVRLMPETELTFNAIDGDVDFDRRVTIVGQGLFTVAPSDEVFLVRTPTALTTVLGTTFGIDADQTFTEVVLAEGRLSVSSVRDAQNVVVLDNGEMSRVLGSDPPSRPVRVDITDALQWTRLFVFRSEPIDRVAERLAEHFGVPVSVDTALGTEGITGTFEHDWSLRYILLTICSSLDAELHETEEGGFELTAE